MDKLLIAFIIFIFTTITYAQNSCNNIDTEVLNDQQCTKIRTYKSSELLAHPILVVTLHGDANQGVNDSFFDFTKSITSENSNVIAVAMLRPGFSDLQGNKSDGVKGFSVGDNYDEPRVAQLAGAIAFLKNYYNVEKVVLVGDSGGAALGANITAMFPGLVDHAFISACPCNINAWRKIMYELTNMSIFSRELTKTSPVDIAAQIPDSTSISIYVGELDKKTPPSLSQEFKSVLLENGKDVRFTLVQGGGHGNLGAPQLMDELSMVISSHNKAM